MQNPIRLYEAFEKIVYSQNRIKEINYMQLSMCIANLNCIIRWTNDLNTLLDNDDEYICECEEFSMASCKQRYN